MEPGSQLILTLNENKLQVNKRTDSHINKKKRKRHHIINHIMNLPLVTTLATGSWNIYKFYTILKTNLSRSVCSWQFFFNVHLLMMFTIVCFKILRHVERALDDIVAAKQSQAEKVCPGLDVWSHVKCAVPLLNNKKVAKDRKANSLMATLSLILHLSNVDGMHSKTCWPASCVNDFPHSSQSEKFTFLTMLKSTYWIHVGSQSKSEILAQQKWRIVIYTT